MKKLFTVSLLIFGIGTTAIVSAGLVLRELSKNRGAVSVSTNQFGSQQSSQGLPGSPSVSEPGTSPAQTIPPAQTVKLTMQEIARHNNAQSCWLLIGGKVYDVTSYINSHPGGADRILQNCGKEATQAFATQGGKGTHSQTAQNMLADYFIGNLDATVPAGALGTGMSDVSAAPPLLQTGREDEWEDD